MKPFYAAFEKILTYNTVLEVISKQANCCFRQFTGWCGSALSYKKHLQLYLEKEIKPKFFVSKYANKVIFLSKTIIRLKPALAGLYVILMPSFKCVVHLQEQALKHSQSRPRRLELRATVLWEQKHAERIKAANNLAQLLFSSSSTWSILRKRKMKYWR